MGVGRFQNIIYITDFTSAKRFKDKNTLEHIKYYISNKYNGNYIFGSINSLRGVELSRRDDLESLAYMLIYFLKGNLPWEHIKSSNNDEKKRKIYQIKKNYNLSILCNGLPEEFKLFLNYVKSLTFLEEPDYNYCFSLFYGIFKKMKIINDGIFSWYQEKKKENPNIIKQFYNKLWLDKYFNNNTSTTSIFRENLEDNYFFKKTDVNIKKSHSCFLNIHNSSNYILKNNDSNSAKSIHNSNKKEKSQNYDYSNRKNSEVNEQNSIEVDINNPDNYLKNSEEKEKDNNISSPSKKEYSIEGKIEQEGEKIKTYEKKKIGKNIKRIFNETKNNEKKKLELIQNQLMKIKKRINNKKQQDGKLSINYINKRNYLNEVNKTFSKKNLFFQTDIINSDYLIKSIPFIKTGNSSTKNDYLKNKIKYFSRKNRKNKDMNFSGFSQINNLRKKSRKNNLTNINYTSLIDDNNIKEIQNINEENTIRKKQKKIISLNLENLILNTQRLKNIINKSNINNNNDENSLRKIKKFTNQNSLNYLTKKNNENNKPEIIKVIKKNIGKAIKPEIKNKIKKLNIYEHKSLICNYLNTLTYKKYSGTLIDNSNKSLYNNNTNYKKSNDKIFKKIPISKMKNLDPSKKGLTSTNINSGRNKRILSSISSSVGKKTVDKLDNETKNIGFGINNTEQNIYRNNNTIFTNFNKINNKNININSQNYIYYKIKKLQNLPKNKKIDKPILTKLVNTSKSPIIHNSISKLNLIQNVSNIYVTTKPYLEEKPLTERKNNVLNSIINKNKNIYIKPNNKLSHDWTLLNKENLTNLLIQWNDKDNKNENYSLNDKNKNSHNYFFSEFNIFKEN